MERKRQSLPKSEISVPVPASPGTEQQKQAPRAAARKRSQLRHAQEDFLHSPDALKNGALSPEAL